MILNDAMPHIEVDPEVCGVSADGELLAREPVTRLPFAQRHFRF